MSRRLSCGRTVGIPLLVGAVAITVPSAAQAAEGPAITFAPKVDYGTAAPADDVVTTDLNQDGVADLVTVVAGQPSKPGPETPSVVSVRLGDGSGALGPAAPYDAANTAATMAAGDLNNDGVPDIVLGHAGFIVGYNGLSVLLGNANGTLQAPVQYAVGAGVVPFDISLGDFNRDGRTDVLAVNAVGSDVGIYAGNGDGTLTPPTTSYPAGAGTNIAGAVADVNRDGNQDAVVVDAVGAVNVLLGAGDGTLGPAATQSITSAASGLVVADFTNDEIPDIAIPNNSTATVAVAKGNGDGTFAATTELPVANNPTGLAAADLNGDGNRDLIAVVELANQASVLTGNGSGGFGVALPFTTADSPLRVATGDFNRDDLPDIVAATAGTDSPVSLLLNTTAPTLRSISPDKGSIAGGTEITLNGVGFQAGTTVKVGGSAATDVQVLSGKRITAKTPPGTAGPADVIVTRADGKESTLPGAFRYEIPAPQSATFRLNTAGRTVVSWIPAAATVQGFEVQVDGGSGCTTDGAAQSCTLRKAYGPSARVEVRAFTQAGSSPATAASHARASKAAVVGKVGFSGSSRTLKPKAAKKARKQAKALVAQGWTRVTLQGTGGTKALGRKRAKAVRVIVRKATGGQLATSITAKRGPNRVSFLAR